MKPSSDWMERMMTPRRMVPIAHGSHTPEGKNGEGKKERRREGRKERTERTVRTVKEGRKEGTVKERR